MAAREDRDAIGCSKLVDINCAEQHAEAMTRGLWQSFLKARDIDMVFQCGQRSFNVHRIVVNAVMAPNSQPLVPSPLDDDKSVEDALLEFMYVGRVTVQEDRLDQLLKLAKSMRFRMLVDAIKAVKSARRREGGKVAEEKCGRRQRDDKVEEEESASSAVDVSVKEENAVIRSKEIAGKPSTESSEVVAVKRQKICEGKVAVEEKCRENVEERYKRSPNGSYPGYNGGSDSEDEMAIDFSNSLEVELHEGELDDDVSYSSSAGDHDDGEQGGLELVCDTSDYEAEGESRPNRESSGRRKRATAASAKRGPVAGTNPSPKHTAPHAVADDENVPNAVQIEVMGSSQVLLCPHCEYRSPKMVNLRRHMLGIHAMDWDPATGFNNTVTSKFHQCPYCDYRTVVQNTFKSHLLISHRRNLKGEMIHEKHKCDKCDYEHHVRSYVDKHRLRAHPSEGDLSCRSCHYVAPTLGFLRKHLLLEHPTQGQGDGGGSSSADLAFLVCPHCDYRTQKVRYYRYHLLYAHMVNGKGEKVRARYKCDDCEYSHALRCFVNKHRLHAHPKTADSLPGVLIDGPF